MKVSIFKAASQELKYDDYTYGWYGDDKEALDEAKEAGDSDGVSYWIKTINEEETKWRKKQSNPKTASPTRTGYFMYKGQKHDFTAIGNRLTECSFPGFLKGQVRDDGEMEVQFSPSDNPNKRNYTFYPKAKFTSGSEDLKLSTYDSKAAEDELLQHLKEEGMAKARRDSDFDSEQLAMGISVEMEHTTNKEVAKEIAKDHLVEIPDYYTRLEELERQVKEEGGFNGN